MKDLLIALGEAFNLWGETQRPAPRHKAKPRAGASSGAKRRSAPKRKASKPAKRRAQAKGRGRS